MKYLGNLKDDEGKTYVEFYQLGDKIFLIRWVVNGGIEETKIMSAIRFADQNYISTIKPECVIEDVGSVDVFYHESEDFYRQFIARFSTYIVVNSVYAQTNDSLSRFEDHFENIKGVDYIVFQFLADALSEVTGRYHDGMGQLPEGYPTSHYTDSERLVMMHRHQVLSATKQINILRSENTLLKVKNKNVILKKKFTYSTLLLANIIGIAMKDHIAAMLTHLYESLLSLF